LNGFEAGEEFAQAVTGEGAKLSKIFSSSSGVAAQEYSVSRVVNAHDIQPITQAKYKGYARSGPAWPWFFRIAPGISRHVA